MITHVCLVAALMAVVVPGLASAFAAAQPAPRTSWGAPDLQGVWDFRSITPMERPEELADRAFLTPPEEAAALEHALGRNAELPGPFSDSWLDLGTATVGPRRTSLVVDPPDGRVPALTPAAARRLTELERARRGVGAHEPTPGGGVEDLGMQDLQMRCITGANSGPPMTPSVYNDNVQIFQTEHHVALLNEMIHNARIVPLDGRRPIDIPQWAGGSRGWWDGDTLVVETAHFLRETSFRRGRASANLRLIERFTRVSPETLLYEATVDDPTVWSRPWTYEVPMRRNDQPLYEYACHEGNYSLYNILAGARAEEAARQRRTNQGR